MQSSSRAAPYVMLTLSQKNGVSPVADSPYGRPPRFSADAHPTLCDPLPRRSGLPPAHFDLPSLLCGTPKM
ncbi:uncharacterized protein LOC117139653 [Drosophila mauritiana]|uniref:Uncharacterized protein LOC117139653 n=1 Tax=Drosophila mauritiana TaxID=7226 RepID=A0A6P8JPJ4_DROMA|nr:uncharacterized protein LOC117139653 [Drosophila mauritiana]